MLQPPKKPSLTLLYYHPHLLTSNCSLITLISTSSFCCSNSRLTDLRKKSQSVYCSAFPCLRSRLYNSRTFPLDGTTIMLFNYPRSSFQDFSLTLSLGQWYLLVCRDLKIQILLVSNYKNNIYKLNLQQIMYRCYKKNYSQPSPLVKPAGQQTEREST